MATTLNERARPRCGGTINEDGGDGVLTGPRSSQAAAGTEVGMTAVKAARYPRRKAQEVACAVLIELQYGSPSCQKVTVAGSIRRNLPEVGDIEILAVSNPGLLDLFGQPIPGHSAIDHRCYELLTRGVLALRPNCNGGTAFGPQNKFLVHVETGIPVDIFSTDTRNWGMALLVRTGPAAFCKAVMSRFQYLGMAGHAYGGVTKNDQTVDCPDEATVFNLLGWPYLSPERRGEGR